MGDNNKSGYQLRADMLGMATGILIDRANRLENNEHGKGERDQGYCRMSIEPYTTEDVIAEAEKLYAFVQKKQNTFQSAGRHGITDASIFKLEKKMNNTIMPTSLDEMITLLESVKSDYNKFYDEGNASAGSRIRKAMQQVKVSAQDVRVHVQTTKNGKQ